MFNPILIWPKLKSNFEKCADHLKKVYAWAQQDIKTKTAIQEFRRAYKCFCENPPVRPHIEQGKVTPQYQQCLYLHNLYRRIPREQKRYRDYLDKLASCDYQIDILKLARHLLLEYSDENSLFEGFPDENAPEQLYNDASRALKSLTKQQKEYLYATNAWDHVVALLVFLVRSKMMLDSVRQLPKNDLFSLDASFKSDLEEGVLSEKLRAVFEENHHRLGEEARFVSPHTDDKKSHDDGAKELRNGARQYTIKKVDDRFTVHLTDNMFKIAVVIPVHKELARLKSMKETLSGEDFFNLKVAQLEFLLDGIHERVSEEAFAPFEISLLFFCDDKETYDELVALNDLRTKEQKQATVGVQVRLVNVGSAAANSKSSNVKCGMQAALKDEFNFVCYTDADVSTNLGQLGALLYQAVNEDAEAVIGSRNLPESWVFGRDPFRAKQSKVYNWLVKLFLGISFRDTQAGFKLFTAKAAKELVEHAFADQSMAFDSELLAYMVSRDLRICEVPIVWFESPLESQSASTATALNMVLGLSRQSQNMFARAKDDPLKQLQEDKLRDNLIALGTNTEFNLLVSFIIKYYELLQPHYLRRFVDSLKTLLYALSRNELTEEEFQECVTLFQELLDHLPESQAIDYTLERYPELLEIAHAIWKDYKLLQPIACFLFGAKLVAKALPRIDIPSFYEFSQEMGLLKGKAGIRPDDLYKGYQAWLGYYLVKLEEEPNRKGAGPQREDLPTTIKGRRASARKLLNDEVAKDTVIHLVVPAMGAVVDKDGKVSKYTITEIKNITQKIEALKLLYRNIEEGKKPLLRFHLMTCLTPDAIPSLSPEDAGRSELANALYRLRDAVRSSDVMLSLYTIDHNASGKGSTNLIPLHFDRNWPPTKDNASVQIHHKHRNVSKELLALLAAKDMPKGILLFLGFNVAYQAAKEETAEEAKEPGKAFFIGYTVATGKIPLEEHVFLLKALLSGDSDENPKRIATGSRRLPESEVSNKPLLNHLRSAILNLGIRALFPDLANLTDPQASCKLLTPEMVRLIFVEEEKEVPYFKSCGRGCDVEMLQLAKYHQGELIEVPISFYESAKESLDAETGLDLITALLKLKGDTPNVNQRPDTVTHDGKNYHVQYIHSGTESMVFKLEKAGEPSEEPLIVKVPHEAIDTEFYSRIDSLCFNRLRLVGLSQTTTRTDSQGLVTNNPLFSKLLSAKEPLLTNWIAYLRKWNEFDTVVLKLIRAYEGKTFKSSGYSNAKGVHQFVVPFRILSKGEYVVIRWDSGVGKQNYVFDDLDHVIVMDFAKDNIERFLRRKCEYILDKDQSPDQQERIAHAFSDSIETAYAFSRNMAEAGLYDLDMNMWADIGMLDVNEEMKPNDLRLLDPGELESLFSNDDAKRCVEILCNKLGAKQKAECESESANSLSDKLSDIIKDYSHPWFSAFQFKKLDIMMNQLKLSPELSAGVHRTCVREVVAYLETLLKRCADLLQNTSDEESAQASTRTAKPAKNYWCIFTSDKTALTGEQEQSKKDRSRRQISAAMLGGDVQGKYRTPGLDEFAVYASKRGIPTRHTWETVFSEGERKAETVGNTLLIGRETVEWDGETLQDVVLQDSSYIPYRGAIATAINAFPPKDAAAKEKKEEEDEKSKEALRRIDPCVALLDAGVSSRMSMISLVEGSKGEMLLNGRKLWQYAAETYGEIARRLGRDDLIVFGAADTLIDVGPESRFLGELAKLFATEDSVTRRKHDIFFFQPPYDKGKAGCRTPVIPQSSSEQDRWILDFVPDWLDAMSPFLPFLHLFEHQRNNLRDVDESGYGLWFRGHSMPGIKEIGAGIASPARDYLREFFRYILISEAIKRYGGLRTPFLFILSKDIVNLLYKEFFGSLDARVAEKLDWYNTIVTGFSSIGESGFIRTHSKHLNPRQAQSLYQLLQRVKRDYWGESHQEAAQEISEQFYQDVAERRIWWHAFESPVDLFNYYYLSKTPTPMNTSPDGQLLKVFIDDTGKNVSQIKCNVPIVKDTESSKTFAVVVAGQVPECGFELELALPLTDMAQRSNFYPYLVYFASGQPITSMPPIQLGAHDMCIIRNSSDPSHPDIIKLPFANLSKDATLKAPMIISIWDQKKKEWEQVNATVRDWFREPVERKDARQIKE